MAVAEVISVAALARRGIDEALVRGPVSGRAQGLRSPKHQQRVGNPIDLGDPQSPVPVESPLPLLRVQEVVERGSVDHADGDFPRLFEADQGREERVAPNETLGAVDRVDDPFGLDAFLLAELLAENRVLGEGAPQHLDNPCFTRAVSGRNR